jgi:ribosomal-protein-alanine N-acetyltransferase
VFALRDYTSADFEEIWILDQICFNRGIAYTRSELRGFLLSPSAVTIVAEREGRIVGFILADRNKSRGHVITIDVHPDHRRLGLATILMHTIEQRLRECGVTEVRLEVAVDNAPALAFYKRHGYGVLRSIPRYYNNSVDALLMRKTMESNSI